MHKKLLELIQLKLLMYISFKQNYEKRDYVGRWFNRMLLCDGYNNDYEIDYLH
jgi:hypothetical protein